MKVCSKCHLERQKFPLDKRSSDGLASRCVECDREAGKSYRQSASARSARSARVRKYRSSHIEQERQRIREYHLTHQEDVRIRRKEDPEFKIRLNLRVRLYHAVRNGKAGSAVKDLGCSVSELKSHLESQFKPGMSWDNYGEWHIDHIKPLAKFDLTERQQFLEACHYTNLQPLWAEENLSKGDR